jgi:hypothetical protein
MDDDQMDPIIPEDEEELGEDGLPKKVLPDEDEDTDTDETDSMEDEGEEY